jgi:hypothetical protein
MPLCASLLVGLLFLMHACMHVLRVRYTRMCRCAAALLSARARLVDACLGVQHAALLIESRPYTQRERAVWLANHLLRRMLDRHTHVVLHAMQDFLARLMRTTAPAGVVGAGGDTVGRRLAAGILDTGPDTLGGADRGLQLELLRCLQLLCEGHHVPGQQALAETGLIKACCDLVKQCHLPQLVMATIHQTGQQQKQEHDRRTGCIMKILVTEQALLTVVEAIQGPNITARQAVLEQSLDDVLCELLVTLGMDRHRTLGQLESEEQEEGETRQRQDQFPPPVTAKSGRKLSVEPPATTASHDKPGGGGAAGQQSYRGRPRRSTMISNILRKEMSNGHMAQLVAGAGSTRSPRVGGGGGGGDPRGGVCQVQLQEAVRQCSQLQVEQLEIACLQFVDACIEKAQRCDSIFDRRLGTAEIYHSLLSQWRFHMVLREMTTSVSAVDACASGIIQLHAALIETPPDQTTASREKEGQRTFGSARNRRSHNLLVAYWSTIDRMLSRFTPLEREQREQGEWDELGLHTLGIKRCEIADRDGQITPLYFVDDDHHYFRDIESSTAQAATTSRFSQSAMRVSLEQKWRAEWQADIMGTDDVNGVWTFDRKVSSKVQRGENLDISMRRWLVHVLLMRQTRHWTLKAHSSPIWQSVHAWWSWVQLYNPMLQQLRLALVLAVNFIVLYRADSRDNIDRRNSAHDRPGCTLRNDCCDAGMCVFTPREDVLQAMIHWFFGVPIAILSLVAFGVMLQARVTALVAQYQIRRKEEQWLQKGRHASSSHGWYFTLPHPQTGLVQLNCFGVVNILREHADARAACFSFPKLTLSLLRKPAFLYLTVHVISAVSAVLFDSPLLYAWHMLDVCTFSTELQETVRGGRKYFIRVGKLTLASFAVMYIFAVVGFYFFPRSFIDEDGVTHTSSLFECVFFTWDFGFRAGGGIGDVIQAPLSFKYREDYQSVLSYEFYLHARWLYDVSFFVIFVLFFSNIILVVMVDGLTDYRESVEARKQSLNNICQICTRNRDDVESAGIPFRTHVQRDHNVFVYLDLVVSLVEKPAEQYTGIESYIAECLYRGSWDFVPFRQALCLQLMEERRAEEQALASKKMSALRKEAHAAGISRDAIANAVNSGWRAKEQLAHLLSEQRSAHPTAGAAAATAAAVAAAAAAASAAHAGSRGDGAADGGAAEAEEAEEAGRVAAMAAAAAALRGLPQTMLEHRAQRDGGASQPELEAAMDDDEPIERLIELILREEGEGPPVPEPEPAPAANPIDPVRAAAEYVEEDGEPLTERGAQLMINGLAEVVLKLQGHMQKQLDEMAALHRVATEQQVRTTSFVRQLHRSSQQQPSSSTSSSPPTTGSHSPPAHTGGHPATDHSATVPPPPPPPDPPQQSLGLDDEAKAWLLGKLGPGYEFTLGTIARTKQDLAALTPAALERLRASIGMGTMDYRRLLHALSTLPGSQITAEIAAEAVARASSPS